MENRNCFKSAIRGLAAASLIALAPQAQANVALSFTNTFAADDSQFVLPFVVTQTSTVTLRSLGYAGGTNVNSALIAAGGFDTIVSLFNAAGNLIGQSDDGVGGSVPVDPVTGFGADSLLQIVLGAGNYTAVLTQFDNFSLGSLAAGFLEDGAGNFTPGLTGCPGTSFCALTLGGPGSEQRTGNYALDLIEVVPEPATIALFGLGLLGLGASRKRKTA